jgi:hypothetical protein
MFAKNWLQTPAAAESMNVTYKMQNRKIENAG